MKKRILSLLCVLALCLGLLPTTALAAGEIELYVGETQITASGYWKTDTNGKLTAGDENDYNVYYDGNGTLTLKNANIQGGNDSQSPQPKDYGIYAASTSSQSVALTINLIGSNTVKGYCGIYVGASGGDSTLVIQSDMNGSLETSGSGWNGITISSNSGNVSLTINNASVEASTEKAGYYGVSLISHTASNPELSLTVNGGSLTAQGDSGLSGIRYIFQTNATNPSISLTVQNNAWVKAMPRIDTATSMASKPTMQGNGIVFDGTEGTVYGNVTLDNPLTIGAGETLTVPSGSSLNCNGKLTNNGTILASGGIVTGSLSGGSTVTTPSITGQPQNKKVTAGETAEFSVTASDAQTYQWQQSTDSGSSWANIESATSAKYTTEATTTSMSGNQYRCVVTGSGGVSVISSAATLTVQAKPATVPVTGVTLDTDKLELFTGESKTLTATVVPETATDKSVTWESSNPDVATVVDGKVTAVKAGEATITVTTADGGKQATCKVKVTQATYNISAEGSLDFGEAYAGYTRPAAKTVTVTNTGNQQVTVTLPTATDFVITEGNGFASGSATIKPGNTATFTVQPKAGLAVGTYSENITVSGTDGATVTIPASFTVKDSQEKGEENAPAATPAPSDNITYYTCPSCGYHNWTATDAGYRCDNCGYLESTRQLSGYGNVKGTYTPGSGATSTAVSTVPQTGDESNPVLWTVLLLVSGLALAGLAIAKRKKQQ